MKQFVNSTNFRLHIVIFGDDFPHRELSEKIGITPTQTWSKGERNPRYPKAPPREDASWTYSVDRVQTIFFVEEVSELFCDLIESKTKIIRDFSESFGLSVRIVIALEIVNGRTPEFSFNKRFLSCLHDLNADIDVDTYVWNEADLANCSN